jgi:hypothetical protein
MATALQKYGGDAYNQQVAQLSGLAGANINPGTSALQGQTATTNATGSALNSLASGALLTLGNGGFGNLFGS